MANMVPRVSLGLPVYNGERYLAKAIEAILGQTYTDFELIISDNASTDRTQAICQAYAQQDGRIRYLRNSHNLGAARNFNIVVEEAQGDYFKWVAHDDLMAPTYLGKCVAILDTQPDVTIAYSGIQVIDGNGDFLHDYGVKLRTDDTIVINRFHDLLLEWHLCFEIFGLIRLDQLRQTGLIGNFGHGDGVLLEQLCFYGRFHQIPEILFFSRKHKNQSMNVYGVYEEGDNDYHHYTAWFDTSKKGKIIFPAWRLLGEHLRTIWQPRLTLTDRWRCHLYVARWAARQRRPLLFDLIFAAKQIKQRLRNSLPEADAVEIPELPGNPT
ncbi:MAG: glycosyltransferase family 2 protein [Chloroflexota bacterium]